MLAGTGEARVPNGILALDGETGDCSTRLELTGGAEAFLWSCGNLLGGSANASEGILLLEFAGEGKQTLSLLHGDRELARHPVEIIKGQTAAVPRVTEMIR